MDKSLHDDLSVSEDVHPCKDLKPAAFLELVTGPGCQHREGSIDVQFPAKTVQPGL